MMSGRAINYEQAKGYYEHGEEYYTRHHTNYDKWHGKLAKRLKLSGALSKGQFDTFCKNMSEEERRKRIGFDATFGAASALQRRQCRPCENRPRSQAAGEGCLAAVDR